MSLGHGRHYLAIPGPSVMPDRVLRAMHRAAPNIYEGELVEMMPGIVRDLKAVAKTSGDVAIYIANGHGVWEAALANTHEAGDRVLVLATGRFAHGWSEMAKKLGIHCDIVDFGRAGEFDWTRVAEALAADKTHDYRSVLVTQVDTSTSTKIDVAALREVLTASGHPALFMVDCIASLGSDPFEMDGCGVDVTVAACQKGLMTPPGIGFVFFNAKAAAARAQIARVSAYWDWQPRVNPDELYQYFCGTAPTHHLYGLREALNMISEEGLQGVTDRHQTLARAVWAAVEAWGAKGPLHLNIADPARRSAAVTTVGTGGRLATDLRQWVDDKAGLTLGIGLGMSEAGRSSDGYFRIGHMGHVNAHMLLGTLGVIEAGLQALEIPHGPGGVAAAARVCAEA